MIMIITIVIINMIIIMIIIITIMITIMITTCSLQGEGSSQTLRDTGSRFSHRVILQHGQMMMLMWEYMIRMRMMITMVMTMVMMTIKMMTMLRTERKQGKA